MRDRDKIIDRRSYIPSFMNDKTFRQKAEYIHNNPVRGVYVVRTDHWIYSSARNYILDDESVIMVNKSLII